MALELGLLSTEVSPSQTPILSLRYEFTDFSDSSPYVSHISRASLDLN